MFNQSSLPSKPVRPLARALAALRSAAGWFRRHRPDDFAEACTTITTFAEGAAA